MSGTIQVKVNGRIPGYPPGTIVKVAVDEEGTPLKLLWRRRLKDAKIDKCCEIVRPEPEPEPSPRRTRRTTRGARCEDVPDPMRSE